MSVSLEQIAERFSALMQLARGERSFHIQGLNSPASAASDDLIFVGDRKHLEDARRSSSQTWVIHEGLVADLGPTPTNVFTTQQVSLCMALIGRAYFAPSVNLEPIGGEPVHPKAVIDPTARLGPGVRVGPNTTIGPRVSIGENTFIGANCTIEAEAEIGSRCHIHPLVYIGYQTKMGNDCEVQPQTSIGSEGFGFAHDKSGRHHRLTHFGRVVIQDFVQIGSNVSIDRGTFDDCLIGSGTIIDNHCHFGHNVTLGRGNIVTAGFISAGSVKIGDFCVFGGRTTVGGHLEVSSHAQFAGLSGISKTVEKPGKYGGYPLQPVKEALKTTASLPGLPSLRKNLKKVMNHLGLNPEKEE